MAKPWNIPDLRSPDSVTVGYAKILNVRIEELFSHFPSLSTDTNAKIVHDTRVSARRLLSALELSRKLFPKKKTKVLIPDLKRLIRSLGRLRENDVVLDMLKEYHDRMRTTEDARGIALVAARIHNKRLNDTHSFHKKLIRFTNPSYKIALLSLVTNSLTETHGA